MRAIRTDWGEGVLKVFPAVFSHSKERRPPVYARLIPSEETAIKGRKRVRLESALRYEPRPGDERVSIAIVQSVR